MKYIYCDAGAYDGDTIGQFYNWGKLAVKPEEFQVIAFEPNPKFLPMLRKKHGANVEIRSEAVWIKDGEIELAIDQSETPLGSTVMPGKQEIWHKSPKVKVKSINFSSWLKQFKDDYVILKMDIEGAEFLVLEEMIKDGTITIPKILMVEFHPNKVIEYTTTYKNELIKRIKDLGVNLKEWH